VAAPEAAAATTGGPPGRKTLQRAGETPCAREEARQYWPT
jgi:hypothetical protein